MRLERLAEDLEEICRIELTWKSFLLRPHPQAIALESFRGYTESWARPASQPDAGRFRVWSTDEAPPSHSVPPAVALKAIQRIEPAAFDRFHRTLMESYFFHNRNVTLTENLVRIARECGLETDGFADLLADESLLREVLADHHEAIGRGVTAVPTVLIDDAWPIVGAQERTVYRQLIERRLREREDGRA